MVLELEDVLALIRSTGETRPEVACGILSHLLAAVRRRLAAFPDTQMLRAFCTRLCEVTVTAARRARGSKAATRSHASSIPTSMMERITGVPVPALLAQARLGKRTRRLAAEVALR